MSRGRLPGILTPPLMGHTTPTSTWGASASNSYFDEGRMPWLKGAGHSWPRPPASTHPSGGCPTCLLTDLDRLHPVSYSKQIYEVAYCEGGGVSSTTSVPFPGRDLIVSLASSFRASVRMLASAIPADYRAVGLKPFPSSESSSLIFPRDRRTVTVRWTALECRRLLRGDSLTMLSTGLCRVRENPSAADLSMSTCMSPAPVAVSDCTTPRSPGRTCPTGLQAFACRG